jgi:glycosyltransferase involved in cell wall biosynthesis
MRLCVIIPCYNEQDNIAATINGLSGYLPDGSCILVINDGSTDNTLQVARATQRAVVIDLAVNLGVGGAVQTGLIFAYRNGFDAAIKFDGDGQHRAEDIARLLGPIEAKQADVTIGSRFVEQCPQGFKSTPMRRAGIKFFEIFLQLLIGRRFTDSTSGFRAYNRKAIAFLQRYYPAFDYPEPEEIIILHKHGLRIEECPVRMQERRAGISSISPITSIYYMLKVSMAILFVLFRRKYSGFSVMEAPDA